MIIIVWKAIAYYCKKNSRAIVISLFNVLVISLLTYVLDNQSRFWGEDLSTFTWIEMMKYKLKKNTTQENNNVLFINVAYDKTLIPAYEDQPPYDTLGVIPITDRKKLLDFLTLLQKSNTYAYIFLDVRFEAKHNVPEIDSLLFNKIAKMRNIVVANHSTIKSTPNVISGKMALNDYPKSLFSTNFVRYKFLHDHQPSMALYAYKELTGKDINQHAFGYTSDGRLCYNNLFVNFSIVDFSKDKQDDVNEKKYKAWYNIFMIATSSIRNVNGKKYKEAWYNLGSDILKYNDANQIAILTKDKYIVIGDMINDTHDTYAGSKSGSLITINAFLSLMAGKHIVSLWLILIMSVIYFLISMSHFKGWSIIPLSNKRPKFLFFICSFFEYTILLFISVFILGFWGNMYISIFVPSLYFSIQKIIVNYKISKS